MPTSLPCTRCSGDGRIANTPLGERWSYWQPTGQTGGLSVRFELVKPLTCPVCQGLGLVLL